MTQGKLSKEEAESCYENLDAIMKSMSRNKASEFIGEFNDLFLFLSKAKSELPSEK